MENNTIKPKRPRIVRAGNPVIEDEQPMRPRFSKFEAGTERKFDRKPDRDPLIKDYIRFAKTISNAETFYLHFMCFVNLMRDAKIPYLSLKKFKIYLYMKKYVRSNAEHVMELTDAGRDTGYFFIEYTITTKMDGTHDTEAELHLTGKGFFYYMTMCMNGKLMKEYIQLLHYYHNDDLLEEERKLGFLDENDEFIGNKEENM